MVWLSFLVVAGQPNFDTGVFERGVALHFFLGVPTLLYGAYLLFRRRLPGQTPLDCIAAALVVVYAAAVIASVSPYVSLEAALLPGAAVLVFYAINDFKFLSVAFLIRGLVAVAALVAFLSLIEVLAEYLSWLRLVNAVDGHIGLQTLLPPTIPRSGAFHHPNVLAMVLNLALPFALTLVVRPSGTIDRPLGALAIALTLTALFFTLSRGGWIATASALLVLSGLYGLRGEGLSWCLRGLTRTRTVAISALASFILLTGTVLAVGLWDSRPQWLFRDSVSIRFEAAATGFDMFSDRPLLGTGPNTYGLLYDAYGGEHPDNNIHPHNAFLSVLVNTGLAGGIVLLAGGGMLAFSFRRGLRTKDATTRLRLAACGAALMTLAVHGLFDSPNGWNAVVLTLAVVAAITVRLLPPSPTAPSRVSQAPRLLILSLLSLGCMADPRFQPRKI